MNCLDCQRTFCDPNCPGVNCRRHHARGLCKPCYRRRELKNHWVDSKRQYRRRDASEVAEDFMVIVGFGAERTDRNRIGFPIHVRRMAAERMGMNLDTLDRALYRLLERSAA